ncbi:MAG: HAD-IIIA family hydrolase [Alphaproteobacteria bacterium]|nr:HAD-IIIA family hydrolase [Alphaproteobacteria bacterium]
MMVKLSHMFKAAPGGKTAKKKKPSQLKHRAHHLLKKVAPQFVRSVPLPELVLLDRDGVINENRPDSVKSKSELVLIAGAANAIARLNEAGIGVAIVTNQSVVGRGLISQAQLDEIHEFLLECLWVEGGARIDHIYYAPDAPDSASIRRKPRPGMLFEAMADFKVSAKHTVMIGDNLTDFEAAYEAGCDFHLVRTGNGQSHEEKFRHELAALLHPSPSTPKPDYYIHGNLAEAVACLFGDAA